MEYMLLLLCVLILIFGQIFLNKIPQAKAGIIRIVFGVLFLLWIIIDDSFSTKTISLKWVMIFIVLYGIYHGGKTYWRHRNAPQ
ncbi:hypothetical protein [Membranihabitans marinus]|uniref:hypothetical protein n=1 Tax=Membranihabitans marinus TaxID=1227546 RepID=UPI001F47D97D|nr:hypothetical protein [Membranihabitans marinus]